MSQDNDNTKSNIKNQAITGLFWSAVDTFSSQGITFFFGIILARLLSPNEFGVVGLTSMFIALAQVFIDGGFSQALIRKEKCENRHYNTVFIFNIICGLLLYIGLFSTAPAICDFFGRKITPNILRIISLVILINSTAIIQQAILIKNINFKLQTKISLASSVVSGVIAIGMAYNGWGVWSLVWKTVVDQMIRCLLLWKNCPWRPSIKFDKSAFTEMFSFGSKMLTSSFINAIFDNVYYIIIGKFFSTSSLGFYTRAEQFARIPSMTVTSVVQKVSYPVLSRLQNDEKIQKRFFRKLVTSTMLISFVLMFGLAAVARPLLLVLVGAKWLDSVIYLRLLCISLALYPLHAINLNVLAAKGRSDLFLRLEVIKKLLAIPIILFSIKFGIMALLIGLILISVISYFINAYYTAELLSFSIRSQIVDVLPCFLVALSMGIFVFVIEHIVNLSNMSLLLIEIISGAIFCFTLCELFKLESYIFIKNQVHSYKMKLAFKTDNCPI